MIFRTRIVAATQLVAATAMCSLAEGVQAQTPMFEVEASDSTKLLRLNSDGGFVLFSAQGSTVIPAEGSGSRFMWHGGRFAVRGGLVTGTQWDDTEIGLGSVAFGYDTKAAGVYSAAFGTGTHASGDGTIAAGAKTVARGSRSVAIGDGTVADGVGSVALGVATKANGRASFAAGEGTNANGQWSVALGKGVMAQGDGSFIFGDVNTSYHRPAQPNQFVVRAFGGILLNTGPFIGCELAPNSGTWSCSSSRTVKEGFEDADAEEILSRVAGLSIKRWRYIGSEAEHIGPIAEEFRQAFGLGTDSTKIDGIDADGIALKAIQALERRTATLQAANIELEADNAALRSDLVALRSELIALRAHVAAPMQQNVPTALNAGGVR